MPLSGAASQVGVPTMERLRKKCKHFWNLTIYERTKPSRINADEYELFLDNDSELAMTYGNDLNFLKRNNAEFR